MSPGQAHFPARSGEAGADAARGLVVYRRYAGIDAIDEYSRRLVGALGDRGVRTQYVDDGLASARRQVADPSWILLQYNPFAYGHWGVAPTLISQALRYRRETGALLAISVHEGWVHFRDRGRPPWRSAVMGAYQRAQLAALASAADVVMATTEALARKLKRGAIHVPVGSNVTPVAAGDEDARQRIGVRSQLVISLFGTGHPSRALEYATAAIRHVADALGPRSLTVLNLGIGAPRLDLAPGIAVAAPGHLQPDELSIHLHASDILLLPFADGVSTRRTTLMAGLAHGLPVVGLRSAATDSVLTQRSDALMLTPVGDISAYCDATLALARDSDRRDRSGRAARELYLAEFDWPVIARKIAAVLADGRALRRAT